MVFPPKMQSLSKKVFRNRLKKLISQSILEVGHFISKKVVFLQNRYFLYRKSYSKFAGVLWLSQDLIVFFVQLHRSVKCPSSIIDCETNFLSILEKNSKWLYFRWDVDVRETIRNPFEIYAYFAARGIKSFFKFRGKLPIKSYVFRPSSQTSTVLSATEIP